MEENFIHPSVLFIFVWHRYLQFIKYIKVKPIWTIAVLDFDVIMPYINRKLVHQHFLYCFFEEFVHIIDIEKSEPDYSVTNLLRKHFHVIVSTMIHSPKLGYELQYYFYYCILSPLAVSLCFYISKLYFYIA